jgi:3-oxoacyl-[acyl-carrier protein] reductase
MDLGLKGTTALIAGASDGLGLAAAEALAAEGCRVLLVARNAEKLERACAALRARGAQAEFLACDLDTKEGIDAVAREAATRAPAVDVLVTNNGGPPPGGFNDCDEEAWAQAWQRTLMSTVRLIRAFLPGMTERGFGRVINITSISVRQPVPRLILSNACRAAVTGMAKTLADEVAAQGVTVNCIAPGYVATRRLEQLFTDRAQRAGRTLEEETAATVAGVPMRRFGTPAEVGALAAFLASAQAAYITGQTILADGGLYRGV